MDEQMLTVAAIITAYLGVFKTLKFWENKYNPLIAVVMAAVFILVPVFIYTVLVKASMIGLMGAGVYSWTKNKEDVK